ncbi:glycoside hydrolase family 57 [Candidatus Parcubacteria bacterium]|nr:glycoside hydrolase family 57 [Candidatus Parcubacteria bacterium]
MSKNTKLSLYQIFHFNLAYSSIPEKDLPTVIKDCYWPLLNLIEDLDVKIGIEASGYTLEKIKEIDSSWIKKLKSLIKTKNCEFIGSGYAQIIGPLVPAKVNEQNLAIGNKVYQNLLGIKPDIAYINEQAYSQGLMSHYLTAGYKALVVEWNNASRFHLDWERDWQYYPQYAVDQQNQSMPIIWNNSIAFQKFQRYVHKELSLEEYFAYLKLQIGKTPRFFSIYGNDAEIFDFRPGRYDQEAVLRKGKEWERIRILFKSLLEDPLFNFVLPSEVLKAANSDRSFNRLRLESPEQPIPVKKQEKYNIIRWALSGRDDIGINTKCFKIYKFLIKIEADLKLSQIKNKYEEKYKINLWNELCFLWGSDFRTHIEEKKFQAFQKRLQGLLDITEKILAKKNLSKNRENYQKSSLSKSKIRFSQSEKLLIFDTKDLEIGLNKERGLSIDFLVFENLSKSPVIGTLPHGYFQNILLGDDFYSGNTIIEILGKSKITDSDRELALSPEIILYKSDSVQVKTEIKVNIGVIRKTVIIYAKEPRIDLSYEFDFKNFSPTSFRSGIITFNPGAFDKKTLFYSCSNGGKIPDIFSLSKAQPMIIEPVSLSVSARSALGNTNGILEVGDKNKSIILKTDMANLAALPMINFISLKDSFFLRVLFSLGETDETSLFSKRGEGDFKCQFNLSISPKIKNK